MSKHPAVAFTEALCRKASEDGWKLQLNDMGFAWKHGTTVHQRISPAFDMREQLFTACVSLDDAVYHLQVELN